MAAEETVKQQCRSLAGPLGQAAAPAIGQVYGAGVWASLALMCASAICGSITDLAFDLEGYLWQLVRLYQSWHASQLFACPQRQLCQLFLLTGHPCRGRNTTLLTGRLGAAQGIL